MSTTERKAIAKRVNVGVKVSQGILMSGKNQKKQPSMTSHFRQNHSSDIESPSAAYSLAISYSFHACNRTNMATA